MEAPRAQAYSVFLVDSSGEVTVFEKYAAR
jgi:hypothetical protein